MRNLKGTLFRALQISLISAFSLSSVSGLAQSTEPTEEESNSVFDWFVDRERDFDLYLDGVLPLRTESSSSTLGQIGLSVGEYFLGVEIIQGVTYRLTQPLLNAVKLKFPISVVDEIDELNRSITDLNAQISIQKSERLRASVSGKHRYDDEIRKLERKRSEARTKVSNIFSARVRELPRGKRFVRVATQFGVKTIRIIPGMIGTYAILDIATRVYVWNFTDNDPNLSPLIDITVSSVMNAMFETPEGEEMRDLIDQIDEQYDSLREMVKDSREQN